MGPSGSGKSTLLTIAGTLEEPTSGEVLVAGADVTRLSRNEQARIRRRSIGYVFQDFNLLPGLTAVENVALPLELDGVGARAARAAALEVLDALRAGRPRRPAIPRTCRAASASGWPSPAPSPGERRLLLADEPTGALDSVNGEAVMRLLRTTCERGRGRRRRHPRRAAGLVGRPHRLPPRRPHRRRDRTRPRPGIPPRLRIPPVSRARHGGAARPTGHPALGVAAVPPGVAPADPGAHPPHRRRGRRRLQRRVRLQLPPDPGRHLRFGAAAHHLHCLRARDRRRPRRRRGVLRHHRRDRPPRRCRCRARPTRSCSAPRTRTAPTARRCWRCVQGRYPPGPTRSPSPTRWPRT